MLIPERAVINLLGSDVARPLVNRLLIWIILTDDYGKPSDEFIDDFIFNFGGAIKRHRFNLTEEQRSRFDDAFSDDTHCHFTGGFDFYMDLIAFGKQYHGHNFKTDARNFIKSWQPATNK